MAFDSLSRGRHRKGERRELSCLAGYYAPAKGGKASRRDSVATTSDRGIMVLAGPQSAPAVLSAVIESHTYCLHGSWSAAED